MDRGRVCDAETAVLRPWGYREGPGTQPIGPSLKTDLH